MLLKLTGSSGAGKTTLAFALADRLDGVVVHDFDEVGVPDPPIPPHWCSPFPSPAWANSPIAMA